jgi:hypothetical protein
MKKLDFALTETINTSINSQMDSFRFALNGMLT